MIDWLLFAFLNLLGAMSPGPDFALVTRYGLTGSKRAALLATFGISSALLIHVTCSVSGIALFLQSTPRLLVAIQLIGALYLGYLGCKMFAEENQSSSLHVSQQHPFLAGFITNLLNPKAMFFLLSFFSQFAHAMGTWRMKVTFALTIPVVALFWFSFLSHFLTAPLLLPFFQRHRRKFMMTMATCLCSFSLIRIIATCLS